MKSRLCLTWSLLIGLFLLTSDAEGARATTLILGKSKPESKTDTPPTGEEEATAPEPTNNQLGNETSSATNVTKLTGIPQIDYIYDPNLPRELNGYNLTDYPFYNSVPEDIDFKCDGLHDGFYASIPHKCQVYHHCLFGTRYDFLCANYTAFDQKTFICHFASEVDCKNSPKYFNRNEALYKAQSTTSAAPIVPAVLASGSRRQQEAQGGRRRRPYRRRKPAYDYYDDYEDSGEQDYYDDEPHSKKRKRPRPYNRDNVESEEERDDDGEDKPPPTTPNKSLYDRPRIAPKIRRPVPVNERDKYDYGSDSRAILAKEPVVEKLRFENRESENVNKKAANHRDYHETTQLGKAKSKESEDERFTDKIATVTVGDRDRERDRDRDRNREYDIERERERERDRNREYDSDRDRERERERHREHDSARERDRERERSREYDSDRERNRDRERDSDRPYRERRLQKKRRRPADISDEDDYEYEDVRRYRNRNRPRYDEYDDDYEYDDRPYRSRNRDSDYRSREHEYEREKGYRNRDSDYERPRIRDRNRGDDKIFRNKDIDRPGKNREGDEKSIRNKDGDRPVRNRDEDVPYRVRDDEEERHGIKGYDRDREDDRLGRNKSASRYEDKDDKSTRNREREISSDRSYYSEAESKKSIVRDSYKDDSTKDAESVGDKDVKKNTSYEGDHKKNDDGHPSGTEVPFRNQNLSNRNLDDKYTDGIHRPNRNRDGTDKNTNSRGLSLDSLTEEEKLKNEKNEEPQQASPKYGSTRSRTVDTSERSYHRYRPGTAQKTKTSADKNDGVVVDTEEPALKPVSVPKYESSRLDNKPELEQHTRKPTIPKRVYFPRPIFTSEGSSTEALTNVKEMSSTTESRYKKTDEESTEKLRSDYIRGREPVAVPERSQLKGDRAPSKESIAAATFKKTEEKTTAEAPKFKVPFDDEISEELAPQAPKPLQTTRRRPFLPSRGGNQNLPRGLQPVGNKAKPTLRGLQKTEKKVNSEDPQDSDRENLRGSKNPTDESPLKPKLPAVGPIEFRAKLTTAIGVQQPQLSSDLYEQSRGQYQEAQDVDLSYYHPLSNKDTKQDSGDYYDDFRPLIISTNSDQGKKEKVQDSYSSQTVPGFREQEKPTYNLRSSIEHSDLREAYLDDSPTATDSDNINARKTLIYSSPQSIHLQATAAGDIQMIKTPLLFMQQEQRLSNQQVGPQTFYSDNPKFKTTLTIPERFVHKPTTSTLNYHTVTHIPVYQASTGIENRHISGSSPSRTYITTKSSDNHKPLIIKFPPPEKENLDDTDEYDISLNDALQPISTLHPRNAPTGVFLTNSQRVPPTNVFKRRSHQYTSNSHGFSEREDNPERPQSVKRVRVDTRSSSHQIRPLVHKAEASNHQYRYIPNPGKYISPNSNRAESQYQSVFS